MVTLLDCINRVPQITTNIIANRKTVFAGLLNKLEGKELSEIILIGSGTSNTSAVTARAFIEKASGLRTTCILPNEFLYSTFVYPENALYVFTSQSGTSTLTQDAVNKMNEMGRLTVGITEHGETPIAQDVAVHVDMGCGHEEYGMRTIGYCSSVLTLMILGMEIGLKYGRLSKEQEEVWIEQAKKIAENHPRITEAALAWFDRNKEQLMKSTSFTIYGGDSLWGVAMEGALKILEISKRKMAVGYEIDDGMHGPTMGYTPDNCVICLNDGGKDSEKCVQLATWAKQEMHNGFVMGRHVIDDSDLAFEFISEDFKAIEFSPVVQVLAYRLAVDFGIDLTDRSIHKEKLYFKTHRDTKKA